MRQFIGEKLRESKAFGTFLIVFSLFGILTIMHQVFAYDTFMRPYLFELPAEILAQYPTAEPIIPAFTTNNVSGCNYLLYFTILSNLLTNLYLLTLGLSILGVKRLQKIGFNKYLEGAVTMFISITGLIYCIAMLPFIDYEKVGWVWSIPGLAMYDFLGYWQHAVVPIVMFVIWHLPFDNSVIKTKKFAPIALAFPLVYAFITEIRGFFGAKYPIDITGLANAQTWFPYPFLKPDRLAPYVGMVVGNPNPPEALVNGLTALAYILVVIIFFTTPLLIAYVQKKYMKKLNEKYEFANKEEEEDPENKYV